MILIQFHILYEKFLYCVQVRILTYFCDKESHTSVIIGKVFQSISKDCGHLFKFFTFEVDAKIIEINGEDKFDLSLDVENSVDEVSVDEYLGNSFVVSETRCIPYGYTILIMLNLLQR